MPDDFENAIEEVVAEEVTEAPVPEGNGISLADLFYQFCKGKQAEGYHICLRDTGGWITVIDPDDV